MRHPPTPIITKSMEVEPLSFHKIRTHVRSTSAEKKLHCSLVCVNYAQDVMAVSFLEGAWTVLSNSSSARVLEVAYSNS